jgi:hypothetical protein
LPRHRRGTVAPRTAAAQAMRHLDEVLDDLERALPPAT